MVLYSCGIAIIAPQIAQKDKAARRYHIINRAAEKLVYPLPPICRHRRGSIPAAVSACIYCIFYVSNGLFAMAAAAGATVTAAVSAGFMGFSQGANRQRRHNDHHGDHNNISPKLAHRMCLLILLLDPEICFPYLDAAATDDRLCPSHSPRYPLRSSRYSIAPNATNATTVHTPNAASPVMSPPI